MAFQQGSYEELQWFLLHLEPDENYDGPQYEIRYNPPIELFGGLIVEKAYFKELDLKNVGVDVDV